jgi:hypothetical protein
MTKQGLSQKADAKVVKTCYTSEQLMKESFEKIAPLKEDTDCMSSTSVKEEDGDIVERTKISNSF